MAVWIWLDRLWLCLIACAFLFMAPIWIILWYEKNPWFGVSQGIFVIWIAWWNLWRPFREALHEDG